MKTCSTCGIYKPLSEFSPDSRKKDGCSARCKACRSKEGLERYKKKKSDPNQVLILRERARISEAKRKSKGLIHKTKQETKKKWQDNNQLKVKAHRIVRNEVNYGRLHIKPCEVCGSMDVQAHHDDYSKPLEVRWLCVKHHNEFHIKKREDDLI